MATPRFAGSYSGFVPAATGLVIGFIRTPNKFKINEYVQYLKTDKRVALYAKLDRDAQVRRVSDADNVWADGSDRPTGNSNLFRWSLEEFRTTRRDFPFELGEMAIEQAKGTWDPLKAHTMMVASQAMTSRTKRVRDLLETTATWGTHTASANDLNGGKGTWDTASSEPDSAHYNAILDSLMEAMDRVTLDTNSVVQQEDMVLVINPTLARKMAASPEIHNYKKYGPYSDTQVKGGRSNSSRWGLPPEVYGFKVVVEDAVYASERPDADGSDSDRAYIKDSTTAWLVSRKGGIDGGMAGSPSWSTVQCYFHGEEMQVEAFSDPKHRRVEGHVCEDFKELVPSYYAGYRITGCLPG